MEVKKLFILLILFVTCFTVSNAHAKRASIIKTTQYSPAKEISFLIEPAAIHSYSGSAKILGKSFQLVQLDLNLALAYQHQRKMFRVEGDYITAAVTNTTTKSTETFSGNAFGLGYGWFFGNYFRIWATYLPTLNLTSNIDQSVLSGTGYKGALSFKIYSIFHLVLEAKSYTFATRKTGTVITKLTGDQAISMQTFSAGISIPWMF